MVFFLSHLLKCKCVFDSVYLRLKVFKCASPKNSSSPAVAAWKWGSRERGKGLNLVEKVSRGGERAGHREDRNGRVQGVAGRQGCEAGLFSSLHKQRACGKVN